jgi:hypothetical protein
MNTEQLVKAIDEEIERLQRVRSLITGHTMPLKRGMGPEPIKRTISPEARQRMVIAQRKRRATEKRMG